MHQNYPRRTRFVKRTVTAQFDTQHGTATPATTQAEQIAARLAELRKTQ